jgi:uncharacterized protein
VSSTDLQIKSVSVAGPAGRLEALLNLGASQPTLAALVCHPHPLYGGTLHNKVVFHAMKALHAFGMPVLRFNFRGAGLSEGEHDEGRGEVDDTRAALDWLAREFSLPVVFAGFSFGAAVGLRACYNDERVPALISLGTPAGAVEDRTYDFSFLADTHKPKLFLSGERDPFGPRAKLAALVASVPEPKQLTLIPGADHFFAGRLAEMRHALESWVEAELGLKKIA